MRENTSSAARKPESRREVCFSLLAEMQVYSLLLSDLYSFLGKDAGEPFFGSQRTIPPQILCFRFFTAPYLLFFSRQCATRRAHRMRRGLGERVKRGAGACSGAPGRASSLPAIKNTLPFFRLFRKRAQKNGKIYRKPGYCFRICRRNSSTAAVRATAA